MLSSFGSIFKFDSGWEEERFLDPLIFNFFNFFIFFNFLIIFEPENLDFPLFFQAFLKKRPPTIKLQVRENHCCSLVLQGFSLARWNAFWRWLL